MGERPLGMPADTPDFMAPTWLGCMHWAIGNEEVRSAFETETSQKWVSPRNALEAKIDEATGHGQAYVAAFIAWANERIWGTEENAPADASRAEG